MTKKLSIILCLTLLSLGSFLSPNVVCAAESPLIAVVNLKLVEDSKATKAFRDDLQVKEEEYREKIVEKQESLRKQQLELDDKKQYLKEDVYKEKNISIRKEEQKAQQYVQQKQNVLNKAKAEFLKRVGEETREIVREISEEKGFSIVVPKGPTIYVADHIDISGIVLERLDQRLPRVNIDIDALDQQS